MRRLAGGEREALAVLYDRHAAAALALARRLCGASAALDVVEDALLELWRNARHGRPAAEDGVRAHVLETTRRRALARRHDGDRASCGRRARSHAAHPSLIALGDEQARAAVASLAPAERHCVELTYLEGLSVAEIATRSRLPAATVDDRLRRGREQVRGHLSGAQGDDCRDGREDAPERLER